MSIGSKNSLIRSAPMGAGIYLSTQTRKWRYFVSASSKSNSGGPTVTMPK